VFLPVNLHRPAMELTGKYLKQPGQNVNQRNGKKLNYAFSKQSDGRPQMAPIYADNEG
jgi:hypothetical protein